MKSGFAIFAAFAMFFGSIALIALELAHYKYADHSMTSFMLLGVLGLMIGSLSYFTFRNTYVGIVLFQHVSIASLVSLLIILGIGLLGNRMSQSCTEQSVTLLVQEPLFVSALGRLPSETQANTYRVVLIEESKSSHQFYLHKPLSDVDGILPINMNVTLCGTPLGALFIKP